VQKLCSSILNMANNPDIKRSHTGFDIRGTLRAFGFDRLASAGNKFVSSFYTPPRVLTPAEEAERDALQNTLVSPADSPMTYLDALTLIIFGVYHGTVMDNRSKETITMRSFITRGEIPCNGQDECRLMRRYDPTVMTQLYQLMGGERGTSHLADYELKRAVMEKLDPAPPAPPVRSNTGDPEAPMGGRRRTQRRQRRNQSRRRQNKRQSRRNRN
jgi:hypothetical protein